LKTSTDQIDGQLTSMYEHNDQTMEFDPFQDPDFYKTSMVDDTFKAMMRAPDSADCTVVSNPLMNYILDEKSSISCGNCNLMLDNMCLHVNHDAPKYKPSPLTTSNLSAFDAIKEESVSPNLTTAEDSVSIDTLLTSVETSAVEQQIPTANEPAEQRIPIVNEPAQIQVQGAAENYFIYSIEPSTSTETSTSNQTLQQQLYTIIYEPSNATQPSPSPSPSLILDSTNNSIRARRKRLSTSSSYFDDAASSCSTSSRKRSRTSVVSVPDEDVKYVNMRQKNNEASRKSRQNRKEKETAMQSEVNDLRLRNKELNQKVELLQALVTRMKKTVIEAIAGSKKS